MRTQQPANQRGPASLGLKKAADLLGNEYTLGLLIPLALIGMHWLWEASK